MLKFLHPTIDWSSIKAVGFDMDGTLYDECDFIVQVYRPISIELSKATGRDSEDIYECLLKRWLEKGSSYANMFQDTLIEARLSQQDFETVIASCLNIFRFYQPKLSLSGRVEKILTWLSKTFPLFLVTDGGNQLQTSKIKSLGLTRWILTSNISISGSQKSCISKPDPRMCVSLDVFNDKVIEPQNVIFFGDRDVDENFARNCGFHFVKVRNMIPVK